MSDPAFVFAYPDHPHQRNHGPAGYTTPESYKPWLRDEFMFRCVYCLTRERWTHGGHRTFSVEHVTPRSIAPTRLNEYENLTYACTDCNAARQDRIVLDPSAVAFALHLQVHEDGVIRGLTTEGARHIKVLRLDNPELTEFRGRVIQTVRGLEADVSEASRRLLLRWVGFPDDLPDLTTLRPPGGNNRPAASRDCWHERRERGSLPDRY